MDLKREEIPVEWFFRRLRTFTLCNKSLFHQLLFALGRYHWRFYLFSFCGYFTWFSRGEESKDLILKAKSLLAHWITYTVQITILTLERFFLRQFASDSCNDKQIIITKNNLDCCIKKHHPQGRPRQRSVVTSPSPKAELEEQRPSLLHPRDACFFDNEHAILSGRSTSFWLTPNKIDAN